MPDWKCWKTWLAITMILAFGLRAAAAIAVQYRLDQDPHQRFLIAGDADGYWTLAEQLAAGQPYEIYDPPRRVMRMPGFPALLAAFIRVSGGDMIWIRLLLAALATAACGLVFWLGCELAGPNIGVIAAGLTAVSPALVGFSPLILSETFFAAMMLLSLITLVKMFRPQQMRPYAWAAAAGVSASAAVLVRPSWLLVPIGAAVLYWGLVRRDRQGLLISAAMVAALAVTLTPWTIRNYRVTGHVVPTTLWVGPSLYDGLNPEADGSSDMTFIERDGVYQRMSEYDADRYYRDAAWDYVAAHPGRVVQLTISKLARYWSPWPNAAQFSQWWLAAPLAAFFAATMALAIIGVWVDRRNWRMLLFAAGPVLYFAAIHAVFVGSIRYRLPAEYPLMVLSAVGLYELWKYWRAAPPAGVAPAEGTAAG